MYPATPPPLPPNASDERSWTVGLHLSSLCFLCGGIGVLAPFLIWLLKKNELPGLRPHAEEIVNWALSVLIYSFVSVALLFVAIGFILLPALTVFVVICSVMGASKASDGILWRYPLNLRLLKL